MSKIFFAALVSSLSLLFTSPASADTLGRNWTEPRAKWFAIGDKAVAGDRSAKAKLSAAYDFYFKKVKSPKLDPAIERMDPYEVAPALMNYRYLLLASKPNMSEQQRARIDDVREEILNAAISLNYPLALNLSPVEGNVRSAADMGVTIASIKMASLYKDLIGNNAAGTNEMLAQMAEYYLQQALHSAPTEAQRNQVTQIKRNLDAMQIRTGAGAVSPSSIMSNELRAIAINVEKRRQEGVLDFAKGCGNEPNLPSSVSGYSRDQMRGFVSTLNAYVEWANCLRSNKSVFADQFNQTSGPMDLSPIEGQRDSSLKDFMDRRSRIQETYSKAAIREAKRASLENYKREHDARGDRIEQAKANANRRYDELKNSSNSSARNRPSRPNRTNTNKPSGESAADRYRRQLDAYNMCMYRVGDEAAASVGVYTRGRQCDHLYPN